VVVVQVVVAWVVLVIVVGVERATTVGSQDLSHALP
jgi:hypothetical protein